MKRIFYLFLLLISCVFLSNAQTGSVVNFAGQPNVSGSQNGPRLEASLYEPTGGVIDSKGNLFVIEHSGSAIRKIAPDGVVSVFAGLVGVRATIDGQGTQARFSTLSDIVIGPGDTLYVAEYNGQRIRKIDPEARVTTHAGSSFGFRDGKGGEAQFRYPTSLVIDDNGNLYITDSNNNRIRKIDSDGNVTTLIGDGTAENKTGSLDEAAILNPRSLVMDSDGNLIVSTPNDIFKINLTNETMEHLVGQGISNYSADGPVDQVTFTSISSMAFHPDGGLYIADQRAIRVFKNDYVATISGNQSSFGYADGDLATAKYRNIGGLFLKGQDSLFVFDRAHHNIRLVRVSANLALKSGVINGDVTWTKAKSPYYLIDDVTVPAGSTLKIESGAIVQRNANYNITIKGSLKAEGTSTEPILFADGWTSQAFTSKFFIQFEETNLSNSKLSHINARSTANSFSTRGLFLRTGNEIQTGTTASTPITGSLSISYLNMLGEYLVADSRNDQAAVSINNLNMEYSTMYVAGMENMTVDQGTFTWSKVKNDESLTLTNSKLEYTNLFQNCSGFGTNTPSVINITNTEFIESNYVGNEKSRGVIKKSEFRNSPIHLPSGEIAMSDSRVIVSRSIFSVPAISNGTISTRTSLVAGGVQLDKVYINTNDFMNPVQITNQVESAPGSMISNSTLANERGQGLIEFFQKKPLIITSTNLLHIRNSILNYSDQAITATGNYFNGLTTQEEIEAVVHHFNDDSSRGLVDFNSPAGTSLFTGLLISPKTTYGRLHSNDYLDEVEVRFEATHPSTETLRLYEYPVYRKGDTTLVAVIESPFENYKVSLQQSTGYAVIAEAADGERADIVYARNRHPQIEFSRYFLNMDEDTEMDFVAKVIDDPIDSVSLYVKSNSEPERIRTEDIKISYQRTEGDTTFYAINIKPVPEAFGHAYFTFEATDGLATTARGYNINLAKVNEHIPKIDSLDVITGVFEDRSYTLSGTELFKSIHVSDKDGGDNLYLTVSELLNGTLTINGNPQQNTGQIPGYVYSANPVWTPPVGFTGKIDAFKVKVHDEDFESAEAVVQFQIDPNTAPVITQIDTIQTNYEDQLHYLFHSRFVNDHIDAVDAQGDPISFEVTSLVNGHLKVSSNQHGDDLELPAAFNQSSNRTLYWYPPKDGYGLIEAFKVKASDGLLSNDQEYSVYFNVRPVNDPPTFDRVADPAPQSWVDEIQTIRLTGISPGPFEDNQTTSIDVISSNQEILPNGFVEVVKDSESTANLNYLARPGAEGSIELIIRLRDNQGGFTQQKVYLTFLEPEAAPVIKTESSYDVYVGNQLNLVPEIMDDRSAIVSSYFVGDVPSWIGGRHGNRIAAITDKKVYDADYSDGLLRQATVGFRFDMVRDNRGDVILSDDWHSVIRKISQEGTITTIAGENTRGYEDGPATTARFQSIGSVAYDPEIDALYIVDQGNSAVRKLDKDGNVSTLLKGIDHNEYGSFQYITVDNQGNVYIAAERGNYYIYKISRAGDVETFAGNGRSWSNVNEGSKDEISVNGLLGIEAFADGNIYFTSYGLLRKIDTNGQVTSIPLPDVLLETSSEVYMSKDGEDYVFLNVRNGGVLIRLKLSDGSWEQLTGKGELAYSEGIFAEDFNPSRYWSSNALKRAFRYDEKNIWLSLTDGNGEFMGTLTPMLDTLKGAPQVEDIGVHEVTVEARDLAGKTTRKTIVFNVLPNNQIAATNLNQDFTFEEDTPEVDLQDIVLSGMIDGQEAKVTLTLNHRFTGKLTTDSGNGETYIDSLGLWQITGSQEVVNSALASLRFIPNPNIELSSEVEVRVINAAGGVPNDGVINLNVLPVNDLPMLSFELKDTAYTDIAFELGFEVEDPDSRLFNFKMGTYPSWLNYELGDLWIERFAGNYSSQQWQGVNLNGSISFARFDRPGRTVIDREGNFYVIEDNYVRKIEDDQVSNYFHMGYGFYDGPLASAAFRRVSDLTFDMDNNMIVADQGNRRLRMVSSDGEVTTLAGSGNYGFNDGDALTASFAGLTAVAYHTSGDIYIGDNNNIRKLGTDGKITTLTNGNSGYGEGDIQGVPFYTIIDFEIDDDGNLIIADTRSIRKLDLSTMLVSTITGDGSLGSVRSITRNSEWLYAVNDSHLMKINPETGDYEILNSTYYNNNSEIPSAASEHTFSSGYGVAVLGDNVFVTDRNRHSIYRIYNLPGKLRGTPKAEDLGLNTVSYQLVDDEQNVADYDGTVNVLDSKLVDLTALDTTYVFTEDVPLVMTGFRLIDNDTDEFTLELKLADSIAGKLSISGYEDRFENGIWTLEGNRATINEALALLTYEPTPNSYAPNEVHILAKRKNGLFDLKAQIYLKGESVNDVPEFGEVTDLKTAVSANVEHFIGSSDADGNLLNMTASDLPEGLKLTKKIVSKVTTMAGGRYLVEGPKDLVSLNYARGFRRGPDGLLYFIDGPYIRMLTRDSVKNYNRLNWSWPIDPQDLLFQGDSLLVVSERGLYWYKNPTEQVLLAGSTEIGDVYGSAQDARFSLSVDGEWAPDRKSIYIADYSAGKVKQVDISDFSVKTIYGREIPDLPESGQTTRTLLPRHVSVSKNGKSYVLDHNGQFIFQLNDDGTEVYPQYPNGSDWEEITDLSWIRNFETDAFGNQLFALGTKLVLLDDSGNIETVAGNTTRAAIDGEGTAASFASIISIYLEDNGTLWLFDYGPDLVRKVELSYEYYLTGSPAEGTEGTYNIDLQLDDSFIDDLVSSKFNLEITSADQPLVTGLDQQIIYQEDDPEVIISPISIEDDPADELFDFTITIPVSEQGGLLLGEEEFYAGISPYAVNREGTATELNVLLGTLKFLPRPDASGTTSYQVEVRRKNGIICNKGEIMLNGTAVNDAPEIDISATDTVAIAGQLMRIPVAVKDIDSDISVSDGSDLPDWLHLNRANIQTSLYAGIPGVDKHTNGHRLESTFMSPSRIDVDNDGNLYVLENRNQRIRKIDTNGVVSDFAGTGAIGHQNGMALQATFNNPRDLAIDHDGNVYVADHRNHVIRKIDTDGVVSTFAGSGEIGGQDGPLLSASLNAPVQLEFSEDESKLFIMDEGTKNLRVIDMATEAMSTFSYGNSYLTGFLSGIRGIAISPDGSLYVATERTLIKSDVDGSNTEFINTGYNHGTGWLYQVSIRTEAMAFHDDGTIILNGLFDNVSLQMVRSQRLSNLVTRTSNSDYADGYDEQVKAGYITDFVRLKDGSHLMVDYSSHAIRKLIIRPAILEGRPSADDVGIVTAKAEIIDTEGLKASDETIIDVRVESPPKVNGLNRYLTISNETERATLFGLNVEDESGKNIELIITGDQNLGQVGVNSQQLLPYDEVKGQWSAVTDLDSMNRLLTQLAYFPIENLSKDFITKFAFRREGEAADTSGFVNVLLRKINSDPVLDVDDSYVFMAHSPIHLNIKSTDADGDSIAYSMVGVPEFLKADSIWYVQEYFNSLYSNNIRGSYRDYLRIAPGRMLATKSGELIFTDATHHQLRKVTNEGDLIPFAGQGYGAFGDGPKYEAYFDRPYDLLYLEDSSILISDPGNRRIRLLDQEDNVSTLIGSGNYGFAEGIGSNVSMSYPSGMTKTANGAILFTDFTNNLVRSFNTNGSVTNIAGDPYQVNVSDGFGSEAHFVNPTHIAPFKEGSHLVSDLRSVRLLTPEGQVKTVTGSNENGDVDGNFEEARFNHIIHFIPIESNQVLAAEFFEPKIRLLDFQDSTVTTVAGTGTTGDRVGPASQARFNEVFSLLQLPDGDILVADRGNSKIKKLTRSVPVLTGVPTNEHVGDYLITVKARDGKGGFDERLIKITILPFNAPPTVTTIDAQVTSFEANGTFGLDLFDYFADAETADDHLIYEVTANSDETIVATQSISSGDGKLIVDLLNAGTTELTIKATDEGGKSVETSFNLTVEKATAEISFGTTEFVFDGMAKVVEATTNPAGLTLNITYDESTSAPSAIGTYQVKAVIDETNYTGESSTTLTILPPNTTPQVTTIDDQEATYSPGGTIQISLFDYFSDAESADTEMTYQVTYNANEQVVTSDAIASADGLLILNIQNAGESEIQVQASDPAGESVVTSFDVMVSKATASISFGDIEFINNGTVREVAVTTEPAGLSYIITYEGGDALPSSPGEFAVEVTIDEANYEGTASTTMTILNIAPEAISLSSMTAFENQVAEQEVGSLGVTDQNPNDSHVYSLPTGLSNNDLFTIRDSKLFANTSFDYETKSVYKVTVMVADDQGGAYQQELDIEILDVNDAPSLGDYDELQVVQDLGQLSFQISGLNTGGEAGQTISITTLGTGVVTSATTVANSGNESVTVTFETATGQQGNGTIEITVKDNGGMANGGVDSFTRVVDVSVLPANISTTGAGSCGAGSVTLTASGADGYAWYTQPLEGSAFHSGNELTENITQEVTYYVAGVFGGQESKLRVPVSATIFDLPATPVINNDNGQLSVNNQEGMSYQWLLDGTDIEGATTNSFTPVVNGNYSATVTNANGCSVTSAPVNILVTSIEATEPQIDVLLFPNPASEFVDLGFGQLMSKGTTIRLVDNAGREMQQLVLKKAAHSVRVNVSRLPEGVHMVLINDQGKRVRKRLMIKR